MSSEATGGSDSERRPSVLGYGSVTREGGSLNIRIIKGLKKSKQLGLPEGQDVLVVGVRGVGAVVVPMPLVVTSSNMGEILDRIKKAINILRENYDAEVQEKTRLFLLNLAGKRVRRRRVRLLKSGKKRMAK